MNTKTTSALSLQKLLMAASQYQNKQKRFLTVIAENIGLNGSDAEGQAASVLLRKLAAIEADILDLPEEEELKKHLQGFLTPFNNITTLAHVHMNLETAEKHFLRSDYLINLTNIHLALSGRIEYANVDRTEADKLAGQFRDISAEIQTADLPDQLQKILLKRTLKMASILDHYYAFGADDLQEELEGLIGAVAVAKLTRPTLGTKIFTSIGSLAIVGLGILAATEKGTDNVVSILENTNSIVEFLDEAIESKPDRK